MGGIRTLGPLNTATRFPVVLVMTASIPLQISAVTRQVSVCSEQLSYHTRNLPDCQVFFAETGNKNHSPKAFALGLQGTSVQLACGFENKREKLFASVALFCREGDDRDALRKSKRFADAGEVRLDFALFELVEFVGDDNERLSGR